MRALACCWTSIARRLFTSSTGWSRIIAVAEELAQEVFLRVYRSRSTYEPTAKFTTWLFRIATHLALNALRDGKNERSQERLDDDTSDMPVRQVSDCRPSVEQSMVYQARLDEVRRAVGTLPEKQRAAVLMHKYEEMEYSQIAKVLSCSESAVKSLLFRAYETLRARLAHMAYGRPVQRVREEEVCMRCPIETRENAELLLAYCARKLDAETYGDAGGSHPDLPRVPRVCRRPASRLASPGCLGGGAGFGGFRPPPVPAD